MSEFHTGLPAEQVHVRLQRALDTLQHAEKNAVLWFAEVLSRRLYRTLGYASMHQYAAEVLAFSPSKTSQFIRLAGAFEELPELKRSVESGEIGWTKAREVAKVATARTEQEWVAKAKQSSRRELEQQVTRTKARTKAARTANKDQQSLALGDDMVPATQVEIPVVVNLRFTPEQYARYEMLLEKLRKSGKTDAREELVLLAMTELFGDRNNSTTEPRHFTRVKSPCCSSRSHGYPWEKTLPDRGKISHR